eukprot:COSAG02_NODE_753_length_17610_cov_23.119753_14_plen_198_part_00
MPAAAAASTPTAKQQRADAAARAEEGVPPLAAASGAASDYASLLESYKGTKLQRRAAKGHAEDDSADSLSSDDEQSEIDVYFDVETDGGGRDEVCVSVRRTETMQMVVERVAAAVGRSREQVCDLMELAAGNERQTVAEVSPSLSLPWRQALTDEDCRFVVPRMDTPPARRGPLSPRDHDTMIRWRQLPVIRWSTYW